jgi:hypothetical protein
MARIGDSATAVLELSKLASPVLVLAANFGYGRNRRFLSARYSLLAHLGGAP